MHDFSVFGAVAVAGKAKISNQDAAFAYVVDYNADCLLLSKVAWGGTWGSTVGITSIYLSGTTLAMTAYSISSTATTEYLLVASSTSALSTTTVAYKLADKALPTTDYVLPARGLSYFDGNTIALLVTNTEVKHVTLGIGTSTCLTTPMVGTTYTNVAAKADTSILVVARIETTSLYLSAINYLVTAPSAATPSSS